MAEAQEPFEGLPFEQLPSGVEVDVEPLAVVDVGHAFGDVDLDAADGVGEPLHGVEVQHEIAVDLGREQLAELRLDHLGTAAAVEGVGLHHAVALGVDEGVPGDLGELGAALVEVHRQHHVGVRADVVGPQYDDAAIAGGHRGHQRTDQLLGLIKGPHHQGRQAMECVAEAQASHEEGQAGQPLAALDGFGRWLGRRRGWAPTIQLRHVVAAAAAFSRLEIRFPPPGVPLRIARLALGLGGGHNALR